MAASFSRFKLLPAEIRLLIWEFAIPDSRIVYVKQVEVKHHNRGPRLHYDHRWSRGLWAFRSYCPPPNLLSVNQESRSVARKHYQLAFSCENESSKDSGDAGCAQTWFDFERDILYLRPSSFSEKWSPLAAGRCLNDMSDSDLRRVKHLALATTWTAGDEESAMEAWVAEILGVLGGVENLYVVKEHAYYDTIEAGYGNSPLSELRFVDAPGEEHISVEYPMKIYTNVQEETPYPPLTPPAMPIWDLEMFEISESTLEEKRIEWNGILDAARTKAEALIESTTACEVEDLTPKLPAKDNKEVEPSKQAAGHPLAGKAKVPFRTPMDLPSKIFYHHYFDDMESQFSFDAQWFVDMLNFNPSRGQRSLPSRVYNFERPNFEHRIVLSSGLKNMMDTSRANYHAQINKNIEAHKLHKDVDCKCGWLFNRRLGYAQPWDDYWADLLADRGSLQASSIKI